MFLFSNYSRWQRWKSLKSFYLCVWLGVEYERVGMNGKDHLSILFKITWIDTIYWMPIGCQMPQQVLYFSHLMQSFHQSLWGRAQFVNMMIFNRDIEWIAQGHTVGIYIDISVSKVRVFSILLFYDKRHSVLWDILNRDSLSRTSAILKTSVPLVNSSGSLIMVFFEVFRSYLLFFPAATLWPCYVY